MNKVERQAEDIVAETFTSESPDYTLALVNPVSYYSELLFRIVVIVERNRSHETRHLGIVENVSIVASILEPAISGDVRHYFPKVLRIRNLLQIRDGNGPSPTRDTPSPKSQVNLATVLDLEAFFPSSERAQAFCGYVRDTKYKLPLDLDRLVFQNSAILAGTGHGKSRLVSQIVSQMFKSGKRVIVIDPAGDWVELIERTLRDPRGPLNKPLLIKVTDSSNVPDVAAKLREAFTSSHLILVDLSLLGSDLSADEKVGLRCKLVASIQESVMIEAAKEYEKTRVEGCYQTCIVVDEAHEFVPFRTQNEAQLALAQLFSISTKEYRKYGLGHVFVDQSLKSLHEDLEISTFILGASTTPGGARFLEERLGSQVADAVLRTRNLGHHATWVAYGVAAPLMGIPWEFDGFDESDDGMAAKTPVDSGSVSGSSNLVDA